MIEFERKKAPEEKIISKLPSLIKFAYEPEPLEDPEKKITEL